MKFNIIFSSIVILLLHGTTVFSKDFPYQKPHRFTNHNYVLGKYMLNGINFLNFPSNQKFNFTGGFRNNAPITKGGFFQIGELFNERGDSNKILAIDNNSKFYLKDSRGNQGLLTRRTGDKKNPDGTFIQDQFIVYLYNKEKKSGSKLIFDIDKFEKYLTQTYEFDNLDPLKGGRPDIGLILIEFAFNAANFDFSNPTNLKEMLPQLGLVNIYYQGRETGSLFDVIPAQGYKSYPITQWRKVVGGPGGYKEYVSYKDLFSPEYGPIIQVLPMTQTDINEVVKSVQ